MLSNYCENETGRAPPQHPLPTRKAKDLGRRRPPQDMGRPAAAEAAKAAVKAAAEGWRIIPRPLLETILNNYALHHRVPQPVVLHGPRGVGKTSLLLHRPSPSSSALINIRC